MNSMTPMFTPEDGLIDQAEFLEKISEADLPQVNTNKNIHYYNVPAAFDIEVSSFYQDDEKNIRRCTFIMLIFSKLMI